MDTEFHAAAAHAGEALARTGPRQAGALERKPENSHPMDVLHLAVVTAADGIRFAAAERRPDVTLARVAEYVSENSPTKLWPHPARSVQDLLARGYVEEAVGTYFRFVGERWDAEQLHLQTIRVEGERLGLQGAPGLESPPGRPSPIWANRAVGSQSYAADRE